MGGRGCLLSSHVCISCAHATDTSDAHNIARAKSFHALATCDERIEWEKLLECCSVRAKAQSPPFRAWRDRQHEPAKTTCLLNVRATVTLTVELAAEPTSCMARLTTWACQNNLFPHPRYESFFPLESSEKAKETNLSDK